MVTFQGAIDRRLYVRALRLQMRGMWIVAALMILAGAIGLANATISNPVTWGWPLFLSLLGVALIASPTLTARKALQTGKISAAPFHGSADEERFTIESAFGRSEIPWSAFHRARLKGDLALLFTSAQQFHVLSREFFGGEAAWAEFTSLVRQHVRSRAQRSP